MFFACVDNPLFEPVVVSVRMYRVLKRSLGLATIPRISPWPHPALQLSRIWDRLWIRRGVLVIVLLRDVEDPTMISYDIHTAVSVYHIEPLEILEKCCRFPKIIINLVQFNNAIN